MKWFVKCIKNYVNFIGRARRREYWNFVLFSFLFLVAASLADWFLFGKLRGGIIYACVGLFLFLPNLAVLVRRLHDTGRSGKIVLAYYACIFVWIVALLISGIAAFAGALTGALTSVPTGFLAVIGGGLLVVLIWGICFLVWCCQPGNPGDNKYGPDPKAE